MRLYSSPSSSAAVSSRRKGMIRMLKKLGVKLSVPEQKPKEPAQKPKEPARSDAENTFETVVSNPFQRTHS